MVVQGKSEDMSCLSKRNLGKKFLELERRRYVPNIITFRIPREGESSTDWRIDKEDVCNLSPGVGIIP
jgi:hypothetical protein